ncbi:MAG TPA: hypothetical protein VF763_06410 [Candidatus Limnocylindrales bacterium]
MARSLHRHGRALAEARQQVLVMRDLMDLQIESADGIDLGRVDDVEAEILADGQAAVTALLGGPQALAGRISSRLRPLIRRLLRDRFDSRIPIEEVAELGLVVRLRGPAARYGLGASDRWLAEHLWARLPGGRR